MQDAGPICLLDKCEPIFEELEDHQVLYCEIKESNESIKRGKKKHSLVYISFALFFG